jgi:hypothetical protein
MESGCRLKMQKLYLGPYLALEPHLKLQLAREPQGRVMVKMKMLLAEQRVSMRQAELEPQKKVRQLELEP